jgi:hypothetical protein
LARYENEAFSDYGLRLRIGRLVVVKSTRDDDNDGEEDGDNDGEEDDDNEGRDIIRRVRPLVNERLAYRFIRIVEAAYVVRHCWYESADVSEGI